MGHTLCDRGEAQVDEQVAKRQCCNPDDRKERSVDQDELASLRDHRSWRVGKDESPVKQKGNADAHQVGQYDCDRVTQFEAQDVARTPVRQSGGDANANECQELAGKEMPNHFSAARIAIFRPKSMLSEIPRSSG